MIRGRSDERQSKRDIHTTMEIKRFDGDQGLIVIGA